MKKKFDIRKIVGQNIKELRESQNLSQDKFAELLGLQSYQTINRIENGKTFIGMKLLEQICNKFGVEPYILLKPKQKYIPETLDKLDEINNKIDEIRDVLIKKG